MSALPGHARTVIIGGGIVGCSVAWHLAAMGREDIVVLERSKLTSGTTWHAAGLVRRLRPSATLTRLINDSIDLYGALEAETGQQTGWLQTGSLAIATNPDRFTHLKRQVSLGRAFGLEAHVIGREEVESLWPLIETDDVLGAVWSPVDGRVNPSDVAQALARGARQRGVRFFEETAVTGFARQGNRIARVEVGEQAIDCEEVVIACGLWSREVAGWAGVDVPLHACEHFYLLTRPVEAITGHLPTLNDQDAYLYARDEVGGLLVGCFEPNARALPLERLPRDFSFDLLNEDWDHFAPMMDNALRRIPALREAEVKLLLNGPESFTLDGQCLLGEAPEVDGLFVLGGMNSTGIALSGGAGRALAEWMVEGEPTLDLGDIDIRRIGPGANVLAGLQARIPEVLGRHYELAWPGNQMATARGQRRSPVHAQLAAVGGYFNAHNGWERAEFFAPGETPADWPLTFGRPAWHEHVAREHRAALESVVLFDQSSYAKVRVEGRDACAVLERLSANRIDRHVGRIAYTAMLNARGGIELDLTVHRLASESFLLMASSGDLTRLLAHLRRHVRTDEHVVCTDVTAGECVLGVAGPQAEALLGAASAAPLPELARFGWAPAEIGLAPVRLARLSWTGEPGFEVHVPSDFAGAALEALMQAGEGVGLRLAGTRATTVLRIEAGFRGWGHELGPTVTPAEAGLGAFVADTGRHFIGQSAATAEPARRIVHLKLESPDAWPLGNEPVWHEGEVAGQVTSACWSHRLGSGLCMALVDRPLAALDAGGVVSGFEVEVACERFAAVGALGAPRQVFSERQP